MTQLTLNQVLALLEDIDTPDTPEQRATLVQYTNNLVEQNGREWVQQNRHRLAQEWQLIQSL